MIMSLPKLTNNHIKNTYLQYLSKYTSSSVLTFRIFPVKHHINLCTYRIFCVDGGGWGDSLICALPVTSLSMSKLLELANIIYTLL